MRAPRVAIGGRSGTWPLVFASGFTLWVASTAVLVATEDPVLLPSVVLIGSFLVPVTMIFWFLDHDIDTALTPRRLLLAFFVAGVAGLLTAAALEVWLLPSRLLPNLWVGLIEEATKGLGVVALASGLRRYTVRDGVLLGAVVGLGFGAFESSGYTLKYAFDNGSFSFESMISEEILRAVIAPFCHGLWTGIFGAALFGAARARGRLRLTFGLVGAYLCAAGLHALWDGSSTAGIVVAVLASGDAAQRDALAEWILPDPSTLSDKWVYGTVQWSVMIVVAIAGSLLVRRRWSLSVHRPRRMRRRHPSAP